MKFLVVAHDHTDDEALARRMVVRERHLAAARRTVESGNMLIGGAILDEEGRMAGSMTVVSFPDRDAFDEWLRNVPYMKNNVWERVEVYPYHVAAYSEPGNGRHEAAPDRYLSKEEERDVTGGRRYYHPGQKDYATFLKTSEETGGERTLIEIELAPGGGNAPHYHLTYDEHFEVLEGTLEVQLGKDSRILRPGEKAVAYKTVLHRFRNPTDEPARFLVELRPGHSGFEKALKVAYGLAADGLAAANGAPKNPYHLALVFEWGEAQLPGIFGIAGPLMRFLARRARRKGIDKELEARYCR